MALLYDGSTANVDHGDIAALDAPTALSIALWARFTTSVANDVVLTKFVSASGGFRLVVLTGATDFAMQFGAGVNASGRAVGSIVADGATWQHWVAVYDGAGAANADRLKIYLNGVDQTLTFAGTVPATNINTSGATVFRTGFTSVALDGALAHLMVWTTVLTAAQAAQQMHMARPFHTTNLVLWAPYDDGTTAADYSGSGNPGTVSGATQTAGPPVSMGAPVVMF